MPQQIRPAPGRARDGDTEQRILEAAQKVFIRRGTAGARMQEIAEEAGVNQALLHYYFRTKDRLATAVFVEAAGRVLPAVLAIVASELPLDQKVERFVATYLDEIRQRPFLPAYIIAELHHHPERLLGAVSGLPDAARPATPAAPPPFRIPLAMLQAQLDAGAAAGELRPMPALHFLVNALGLTIFPFLAQPLLRFAAGMDDAAFDRFLDERKRELPGFIMRGLRA